jgi:hypothetical protein
MLHAIAIHAGTAEIRALHGDERVRAGGMAHSGAAARALEKRATAMDANRPSPVLPCSAPARATLRILRVRDTDEREFVFSSNRHTSSRHRLHRSLRACDESRFMHGAPLRLKATRQL